MAAIGGVVLGPLTISSSAADAEPPARDTQSVQCSLNEILVPSCGVLWGTYSRPSEGRNPYNTITDLESEIGRNFDFIHRYHDFSNSGTPGVFPDRWERMFGNDDPSRTLFFNWTTRIHGTDDRASWHAIAAGEYDESVIRPVARRIAEWGRPAFLAFDHEAEGNRRDSQGNGPQYVEAWRHIHEIFEEEGATNTIWTWIHVGWTGHAENMRNFYPGDEYVDWIGYDPFNYYVCRGLDWRTPGETIGTWYRWLMRNGFDDKPIVLAEYGTVADPEDEWAQAQWYRNLVPALRDHPRIKAVSQFNTFRACDTRVTTRPDVLEAYGEAGRHPYVDINGDQQE
jgi:hypothetical protein